VTHAWSLYFPSVLWCCCLGNTEDIWPVKVWPGQCFWKEHSWTWMNSRKDDQFKENSVYVGQNEIALDCYICTLILKIFWIEPVIFPAGQWFHTWASSFWKDPRLTAVFNVVASYLAGQLAAYIYIGLPKGRLLTCEVLRMWSNWSGILSWVLIDLIMELVWWCRFEYSVFIWWWRISWRQHLTRPAPTSSHLPYNVAPAWWSSSHSQLAAVTLLAIT